MKRYDGPRHLRPGEFESMLSLLDMCFPGDGPEGIQANWPHVCLDDESLYERYLVHADGRRIVACLGIVPMKLHVDGSELRVGGVSIVATHPSCRGRGMMTGLIESATAQMRRSGFAMSWLNGDRLRYGRFGWERAGRKYNIELTKRSLGDVKTSAIRVRTFEGSRDSLPAVARMYDAWPLRCARDSALHATLLGRARKVTCLAYKSGRPVGYMATAEPGERTRLAEVHEYRGNGDALRALASDAFARLGVDRLRVSAPVTRDGGTEALLASADNWGLGFSGWAGSGGMVKILDLRETLTAFAAQMEARRAACNHSRTGAVELRITGTTQRATLQFGKRVRVVDKPAPARVSLAERAMVRTLFGLAGPSPSAKCPAPLRRLLPLDFFISPLEMV